MKNNHELTPEEWKSRTTGTWLIEFDGLADFVYSCYLKKEKGIEDLRFPEGFHFQATYAVTTLQAMRTVFYWRHGIMLERPYISIA